jgi:hypothetical protein
MPFTLVLFDRQPLHASVIRLRPFIGASLRVKSTKIQVNSQKLNELENYVALSVSESHGRVCSVRGLCD